MWGMIPAKHHQGKEAGWQAPPRALMHLMATTVMLSSCRAAAAAAAAAAVEAAAARRAGAQMRPVWRTGGALLSCKGEGPGGGPGRERSLAGALHNISEPCSLPAHAQS